MADGQGQQHHPRQGPHGHPDDLEEAGLHGLLEGGLYRRHGPQHGEDQPGAGGPVQVHNDHGGDDGGGGLDRAQTYVDSGTRHRLSLPSGDFCLSYHGDGGAVKPNGGEMKKVFIYMDTLGPQSVL